MKNQEPVFNRTMHIKLWEWLKKYPEKEKFQFFDEQDIPESERPYNNCYACQYAEEVLGVLSETESLQEERDKCNYCPLTWLSYGSDFMVSKCTHPEAYYNLWERSADLDIRSVCAGKVAYLPLSDADISCK